MNITKVKEFWLGSNNELEDWQKANPKIKILDTKIVSKTYVENRLLVTYEEEEEK